MKSEFWFYFSQKNPMLNNTNKKLMNAYYFAKKLVISNPVVGYEILSGAYRQLRAKVWERLSGLNKASEKFSFVETLFYCSTLSS